MAGIVHWRLLSAGRKNNLNLMHFSVKKLTGYFILLTFVVFLFGCNQADQTKTLELIGHRGATGLLPENTIPGFKKALEYGVDGIEFDVVITGDDQVVISHEPWFRHDICLTPEGDSLNEKTQMEHLIYEMSYDEIAQYDCGSMQRPGYPDQQTQKLSKPLMNEAVREVESFRRENNYAPVDYKVEIKSDATWDNKLQPEPEETAQIVYDELQATGLLDRINILAFDERILNAMNEIDSTLTQVYLISGNASDISANLAKLNFSPEIYAPSYSQVDSILVERIHAEGMRIFTWTVNDYDDMVRLIDMGVDGIISDYPNFYNRLNNYSSSEAGGE